METIIFQEKDNLALAQELYRMRYRVFAQKLHWVDENSTLMETDEFDGLDRTTYVILKEKGEIVGHVRLIAGSPSLTEVLAGKKFTYSEHLCISRLFFARGFNTTKTNLLLIGAILQIGVKYDVEYFIGCTFESFVKEQLKVSLPFPTWLERNIGKEKALFYKANVKALMYFLKLSGLRY